MCNFPIFVALIGKAFILFLHIKIELFYINICTVTSFYYAIMLVLLVILVSSELYLTVSITASHACEGTIEKKGVI